ncbi:NAD-dependent succinate-semialdehyde dehydrogenase [Streptomyces sp. NPDC060065]|uniref:NAD-dependent succinate-semialdehyde dehydrogenase n=1 Tax=Streptomyces sp. NPDC060065 TaxID=3347050 RepID=UPI0036AEBE01
MTMYKVTNPATGKVESEYATAGDGDIQHAIARAHASYKVWRSTSLAERSDVLRKVAQLTEDRAAELGRIATREMGKTTTEADGELEFTIAIYRYYADNAAELLADQPLVSHYSTGRAWVRRAPIGALLGVMPWNFPYYQVARFAGPNLLVGNTIVLKHAPQCPESALAQEAIFTEAGLPRDAYINIFATNEQVATLIADPRIAGVSVTGSERAGTAVAALAGQHLKKVVLELGGSDPFIVLDTDDVPGVAQAAVAARMENAGQSCNAAKRIIVADTVYDDFAREFTTAMGTLVTGDPLDPDTAFGPLSSEAAAQALVAQIDDAVSKGATLLTGGHRVEGPGAFVEPTVLADVTPDMRAYHEELFGPAAVLYRVSDKDEAVALANSSAFGLGGAVFSQDEEVALEVADRLDVGMVWINQAEGGGPELPFGGTKRSGIGRELGPLGVDEFVNKKLMHTAE